LHRVYPPASAATDAATVAGNDRQPGDNSATDALGAVLQATIEDVRRDRDHWRDAFEQAQRLLAATPVTPPATPATCACAYELVALAQIDGVTMNKPIAIAIATGAVIAITVVLTDYWMLDQAQQAALGNASRWTVSVCERPGHHASNWPSRN